MTSAREIRSWQAMPPKMASQQPSKLSSSCCLFLNTRQQQIARYKRKTRNYFDTGREPEVEQVVAKTQVYTSNLLIFQQELFDLSNYSCFTILWFPIVRYSILANFTSEIHGINAPNDIWIKQKLICVLVVSKKKILSYKVKITYYSNNFCFTKICSIIFYAFIFC